MNGFQSPICVQIGQIGEWISSETIKSRGLGADNEMQKIMMVLRPEGDVDIGFKGMMLITMTMVAAMLMTKMTLVMTMVMMVVMMIVMMIVMLMVMRLVMMMVMLVMLVKLVLCRQRASYEE